MAKRRITATAKSTYLHLDIKVSTSIYCDGILMKSEQDARIKQFKNSLYKLLSDQGFDYDDIKIK